MKRTIFVLMFGLLLGGCATVRPPEPVEFRALISAPKAFEGRRVEVRCWLLDDGFETHLVREPAPHGEVFEFSFASRFRENSPEGVVDSLWKVLARKKRAEVTIVGALKVYGPSVVWPKGEFTIERILDVKEIGAEPREFCDAKPSHDSC